MYITINVQFIAEELWYHINACNHMKQHLSSFGSDFLSITSEIMATAWICETYFTHKTWKQLVISDQQIIIYHHDQIQFWKEIVDTHQIQKTFKVFLFSWAPQLHMIAYEITICNGFLFVILQPLYDTPPQIIVIKGNLVHEVHSRSSIIQHTVRLVNTPGKMSMCLSQINPRKSLKSHIWQNKQMGAGVWIVKFFVYEMTCCEHSLPCSLRILHPATEC